MELKQMQTKRENIVAAKWDGTPEEATAIMNVVLTDGGMMAWACLSNPCPGLTGPHNLVLHTPTGVKTVIANDWVVQEADGSWTVLSAAIMADQYEEATP